MNSKKNRLIVVCVCMWVARLHQTHIGIECETEESNVKISRVELTLRRRAFAVYTPWESILCYTLHGLFMPSRSALNAFSCIFYMIPNSTVDSRTLVFCVCVFRLLTLFMARNAWHSQVHITSTILFDLFILSLKRLRFFPNVFFLLLLILLCNKFFFCCPGVAFSYYIECATLTHILRIFYDHWDF